MNMLQVVLEPIGEAAFATLPVTLPLAIIAAVIAHRSKRPAFCRALFFLGCIPIGLMVIVIGWRWWLQLTLECGDHTEPWVDCGALGRSTIVVPIMFGIPLVPLGVVLVLPWLISRRREALHSVGGDVPDRVGRPIDSGALMRLVAAAVGGLIGVALVTYKTLDLDVIWPIRAWLVSGFVVVYLAIVWTVWQVREDQLRVGERHGATVRDRT